MKQKFQVFISSVAGKSTMESEINGLLAHNDVVTMNTVVQEIRGSEKIVVTIVYQPKQTADVEEPKTTRL